MGRKIVMIEIFFSMIQSGDKILYVLAAFGDSKSIEGNG